jgi:hypothetical protein
VSADRLNTVKAYLKQRFVENIQVFANVNDLTETISVVVGAKMATRAG